MATTQENSLNEHVVELRFKPDSTILDRRGEIAKQISSSLGFSEWLIIENRVDIYTNNSQHHAFVGFSNAGYVVSDSATKDEFPDKSAKFLKLLLSPLGIGSEPHIERVGVRSKFITEFKGSFDTLVQHCTKSYLDLRPGALDALGKDVKLIDVGAPLNFIDNLGNFNTHCGPMLPGQASQFFRRKSGFPQVGLYYDIDYFLKPGRPIKSGDIVTTIIGFAKRAWERNEMTKKLILGSK